MATAGKPLPWSFLFYKVEQWSRDGMAVERLLYAGNSLAKAEDIFARERTRVLQQFPDRDD